MPCTRTQASKLLTAAEMALFDAARGDAIGALTTRALKAKVERTRRLRDKYRDLHQRQRLATRAAHERRCVVRRDAANGEQRERHVVGKPS